VLCVRNPLETAASLENAYGFTEGVELWLAYVRAALENSAGASRLILSYENTLNDPQCTLTRLAAFVGRPKLARKPAIQAALDDFIERDLRHHHSTLIDTADDGALAFEAKSLYLTLVLQERLALTSKGGETLLDGALEPFADSALTSRLACRALEAAATEADRREADQQEASIRLREELMESEARFAAREAELDAARVDLATRNAALRSAVADNDRELASTRSELQACAEEIANAGAVAERERERLLAKLRTREDAMADQEHRLTKLRSDLTAVEAVAAEQGDALAAAHAELVAREAEITELRTRLAPPPLAPILQRRTPTASPGIPRCSIVIPVFNKASLTRRCLDSLLDDSREDADFDVIVVDDASTDSTADLLAAYGDCLRVITHATNSGFAAACNAGAAAGSGEYLVFLNNDTLPQPGWLDALVAYADAHELASVVGSKLLFPDGTVQHAGVAICQDGYPRHIYAGFSADHPAVNRSKRFQVVTGACMLVRRSSFEEIGGFDTAFRNGYEDVDLCLRLSQLGFQTHYCHESVLFHLESVSRQVPMSGQLPRHEVEHNTKLYVDRWLDSVQPDDLRHYLEDGLLQICYSELYPLQVAISPELALLIDGERELTADRMLSKRSRQFLELLRDNIRLSVQVAEADLATNHGSQNGRAGHGHRPEPAIPERVAEGEIHWLSNSPSGRVVSVIMPVKNGAERLRELLPRVLAQETKDSVEIVAVDSGSSDDTVDVLREFGATVISIAAAAFNHGLTRNLAAGFARGEILVFLNQSAMPADKKWLGSLVAALDRDPFVAGACSCVLPREDADLLTRRDGLRDPSGSLERQVRQIDDAGHYATLSPHQLRLLVNFHTVSAAIRADVLARIPFREVLMGEDMLWAKEVLEAGLKIQHEPSSVVLHSHAYSYADVLRRNVDDGFATREIVGRRMGDEDVVPTIMSMVRDDWRFLEKDCELNAIELEQWRLDSVLRRSAQIVGQWLGTNRELLSDDLFSQLSITERIRNDTSRKQTTLASIGGPTGESP
jgi:GT2 family glycosyltransferase